jgi:GT2 family glycosyltransferase
MRVPLSPCASVVVPVHRIIPRLRGCLEALRAQSERPEIVLSLDGPVDLAPELAALADLVVEGPRTGPAGARNRGWKAASGKLILFTDSDCVPEPGWASALIAGLEEGADGCKGVYSRGGVRLIQRLAQVEFEQRYEMLSRKETIDLVDTYSAGFRRSALERVGGFDESFPAPDSEDVDLSWRLCAAGFHLAFVPGARVEHEHRPTWRAYFQLKLSRGRWRMKLQMLLAGLLLPAAAASALIPAAAPVWLGAFLLACIPLAKVALRVDPVVAHAIPAFCLVRGTALLAGTARGLLGGF